MRLIHIPAQGLGCVAVLVELVGESELVLAGAPGALAALLGWRAVWAGDRLDADGVGELVPAGAPPAGTDREAESLVHDLGVDQWPAGQRGKQ
jgi:hypothetical protein